MQNKKVKRKGRRKINTWLPILLQESEETIMNECLEQAKNFLNKANAKC